VNRAIERLEQRPDDPRLVEAKSALAWCELRAGRLQVARGLLAPLAGAADCGENDYLRMRVHYWLGEALLALGEKRSADAHVRIALRLVRERGYLYFLKVQAREDAALPLHALARGIEPDLAAAALVEAGGEVEASLLAMLDEVAPAAGETVLAVLAEIGGPASSARLPGLARARRALQPGIRSALRHIRDRGERGTPAGGGPAAPAVRLVLYGPPHLKLDSRALPASAWRTQRAFQVLVYFALHPRGVDRDRLIDCFWPGRQAAAGRRNLHPTLSYVRSVLPRTSVAPILRDGERYRLNPAYPITCDAWDAERSYEESRNADEPMARRAALERAVELAGERPLEGLYADWAREFQVRDRDRLLRSLLDLGELCASSGDHEDALGHFRKALELDAYREGTCVAVVRCLVRLGNRRAAMVEYERLRSLLRKELDVEPLPETESAVRQLLSGEGEQDGPEEDPPIPTPLHVVQRVAGSAQVRLKGVGGGFRR